jgi:hypothetical protein
MDGSRSVLKFSLLEPCPPTAPDVLYGLASSGGMCVQLTDFSFMLAVYRTPNHPLYDPAILNDALRRTPPIFSL